MKEVVIPIVFVLYEWFFIRKPIKDHYAIMQKEHELNRDKLYKMLKEKKPYTISA
jgi:hypothetical protein